MFTASHDYQREELLNFVGSKQGQSGIIWGPKEITCVIITSGGKGGKSAGYDDMGGNDGSKYYIGQGEKGDQDPDKYSNSLLVDGKRSVLFFSTTEPNAKEVRERGNRKKLYRFEGIYEVASWDYFTPSNGKRSNDKLLRFHLVLANSIFNINSNNRPIGNAKEGKEIDLLYLRQKLLNKDGKPAKGTLSSHEYFLRSQEVVDYAKKRANGQCELCDIIAPFFDIEGNPYLEVHHIFRLADDGPDSPNNVAALCPNCHKEAHFGLNKNQIKDSLEWIIFEKEIKLL